MKKLFLIAALLFALAGTAQKVYNLDAPKPPKTEQQLIGKAQKTSDQATLKGVNYPVYRSDRGKFFIIYTNKKGNLSKKYIPATQK